jgi:hypothetical protein
MCLNDPANPSVHSINRSARSRIVAAVAQVWALKVGCCRELTLNFTEAGCPLHPEPDLHRRATARQWPVAAPRERTGTPDPKQSSALHSSPPESRQSIPVEFGPQLEKRLPSCTSTGTKGQTTSRLARIQPSMCLAPCCHKAVVVAGTEEDVMS